jgi:hypothetical protein
MLFANAETLAANLLTVVETLKTNVWRLALFMTETKQ